MRLRGFLAPAPSFLSFLKTGVAFAFSQSSGISPNHHDQSKTTGSGLSGICQFLQPLWPHCMDLWIYKHPVCLSIPWPDPCPPGVSLLLQTVPLISWIQDSWRLVWLLKTEANKTLRVSAFSTSCVTRFHSAVGPHFPSPSWCHL